MGVVRMVDGSKRVEAGCMLDGLAPRRNQGFFVPASAASAASVVSGSRRLPSNRERIVVSTYGVGG